MRIGSCKMETAKAATPSKTGGTMYLQRTPAMSSIAPLTAASKMAVPRSGSTKTRPSTNVDEHAGQNDAAIPSMHVPLATISIPRQQDDEREFGEFGGLKAQAVEIEPAARAVDFSADVRHEHQHQQKEREEKNRPGVFFEHLIVEGGRRHTKHKSERKPVSCFSRSGAKLRHARAVKHHQPQRQQGSDAKRQSRDGDFHFNAQNPARRDQPHQTGVIGRKAHWRVQAWAPRRRPPARGTGAAAPELPLSQESLTSGRL